MHSHLFLGVGGQREGDVIHVIARRVDGMSPMLASLGGRADIAGVYRASRADVLMQGIGPDLRGPSERPLGKGARNIYISAAGFG